MTLFSTMLSVLVSLMPMIWGFIPDFIDHLESLLLISINWIICLHIRYWEQENQYLGDTNCDMLDPANNDTKHLYKLLIKFNVVQLIKKPTRTTAKTNLLLTILLLINQNLCQRILPCPVESLTKRMRLPKLKALPKLLNVRNYKRFNVNAFWQDISSVPFDEIKNVARDAEEM